MRSCKCRWCEKQYDPAKSRADRRGYCSAKCVKLMVRHLAGAAHINAKIALKDGGYRILKDSAMLGDDLVGETNGAAQPLDEVEELRRKQANARVWRYRLRKKVLELLKEYCDEAEHQDGYDYREDNFNKVEEAVTDFGVFLKELEGGEI